ncbi:lipocalin-like domain-containing protein [Reyranella sp. CPCC 100927]|uniref:lipocalin-like domain-containing protein n=1 Tax=Reyranella sp. CPCC 100927 TaxID=2599616 RepID=UPI0015B754B6|nr:lipocalin-like domain-containing protein [Reyranella sp. CPCC 100927]
MSGATDHVPDEARAVSEVLVGAWSLLECAEVMQDGAKRLPFGDRALGQVIYTADGRMSAQLVRAGRAAFASDDYRAAPIEILAEAFQQYFGYFGRYTVDAVASTVTHFIDGASIPNLENKAQVRTFRLEEDRLVLEAAMPWGFIRNTWIRAGTRA